MLSAVSRGPMLRRLVIGVAMTAAWAAGVPCRGQQAAPPAEAGQTALFDKQHPENFEPHDAREAREWLRAMQARFPAESLEVANAMGRAALLEAAYEKPSQETLDRALAAAKIVEKLAGKDSSAYAYLLAVQARVQTELDRPDLARPLAEQALAIAQSKGSTPDDFANIVNSLSIACGRQGDLDCALRAAKLQVEAARQQASHQDPAFLASALNSLATQYHRRREDQLMEAPMRELMELEAKQKDLSDPIWTTSENTISLYYSGAHQYEKAREHLLRALELDSAHNGKDDLDQAVMVANLAFAEMALGHFEEGYRQFVRAHGLYVRRFGPAHSRTAEIDYRTAVTLHFLGRDKDAMDWALNAHRSKRQYISLAIRLMPERQALTLAGQGMPSLGAAVTIALAHPEMDRAAVYQEVVRSRRLVAEEMALRAAALNRKHDPTVAELEKELEADRRVVMELQGSGNNSSDALADAVTRMEKAEREMAERSASFRADERTQSGAVADLRANLPADSVLVSYVRFEKIPSPPDNYNRGNVYTYAAFVLHGDGRLGAYSLSQEKNVADLVEKMRTSAEGEAHGGGLDSQRTERAYREAGEQLRKLIWDPLAAEVKDARRVLIVPDGVLNLVPFSSLPQGNGYMVEHGPVIHVLTSERDLLPGPVNMRRGGLLALGGPSFEVAQADRVAMPLRDGGVTCDAFAKMAFQPLPGALGEVKDVSATWQRWNGREPAQLLTGDEATRDRFMEAAPRSRVLHIATHAFVLERGCGNGNPLLNSGLVFAGANKTRESSVLTAQQIASLDLSGVDWAVLSACNSGYGELKDGEGVIGLQRSFRVAGAKSVVMALWPVDDAATRTYMRALYRQRFGLREPTSDAVWNAARNVLLQRRGSGKSTHPWYWASFVGAGSWQ